MSEPLLTNPSLLQRVDVYAVTNARSNTRRIWLAGLFGVWTLLRLLFAAVAGAWGVFAIGTGTLVICSLLWFVSLRAKRRVPETKQWLEHLTDP